MKVSAVVLGILAGGVVLTCRAQERVLGADISYWNGAQAQSNWNTACTNGNRKFVWIRATRGGTTGLDQPQGTPSGGTITNLSRRYDDPRFIQNINRATAAGMHAGPYHYGRPSIVVGLPNSDGTTVTVANTGTDEADHFIQMAGPWMRPGYLMPVFDLEDGQGVRTANELAQFSIDFSERVYQVMRIRPAIYLNGNYANILQGASASLRDQLAKPAALAPSVVSPAFPMQWFARYSDNSNPDAIPVQTGSPKHTYTTLTLYYGPWDDYGDPAPWSFWQYASTVSIPGFNATDSTVDGNVAQGDIEYVRNYLVPAVWWHDGNGDWSTLTNWNSGQTPVPPVTPPDQAPPYETGPLPTPRLPGAAGSGPTSGQYDTVILERPNANITVTLTNGTHNIRKLYVRETLQITGGSLTVNYDPTYRPDNSTNVLHGGPISAQFSGSVTLGGTGSLTLHTLQVDTNRTFTLSGGTLTFHTIRLMPHSSLSGKILVNGNVTLNARSNVTAVVARGPGSGNTGSVDLGGGNRTFTIGDGTNEVDVSFDVPLTNGGLVKAGAGTLRITNANAFAGGTTVSAGRLLVNNSAGSGTGSGTVTVNGGFLSGTGTISGVVTVNAGGTLAPGTASARGMLTLNSPPVLAGTNFMRIHRGGSPASDRLVLTSGTLTYGGTLVVSNTGAAPVGGDAFALFSAPAYAGDFAAAVLPPLSDGLNWYLGTLTHNGSLVVNRRPAISPLHFTNPAPGTLEIPLASLTAAASDPDGDPISLAGINLTTTNGITLVTNATSVLYANPLGVADRFSYTVSDGRGGSTNGVVYLAANPAGWLAGPPHVVSNAIALQFVGLPGWTYYLERSTNLQHWVTIGTNVAPANGQFGFTDPLPPPDAGEAQAFYRLRWLP